MTELRKLLICPWFGPLPTWFPLWRKNIARLEDDGYDVLLDHDLDAFKSRVNYTLGVNCPIVAGTGKIHDYRAAFGLLYEQELEGYDFWGHTDFDCVYGRVGTFLPDFVLKPLDIFSNHIDYMSGPWSLYRNSRFISTLFMQSPHWAGILEDPVTTGWVEREFTRIVDQANEEGYLRRQYESWQTRNLDDFSSVHFDGDKLLEGHREIMVAHFRRTKVWPKGCW